MEPLLLLYYSLPAALIGGGFLHTGWRLLAFLAYFLAMAKLTLMFSNMVGFVAVFATVVALGVGFVAALASPSRLVGAAAVGGTGTLIVHLIFLSWRPC